MKTRAEISGIISKYGLGDGSWFDDEVYAHLGVRIGEALLKRNPKASFVVHQLRTTHNPIRLHMAEGLDSLDLSGSVSLRGLRQLCWSHPTLSQSWDDWGGNGYGGMVDTVDLSTVEGRIFDVRYGVVVYRRDDPKLVDGIHEPEVTEEQADKAAQEIDRDIHEGGIPLSARVLADYVIECWKNQNKKGEI
jgi:hypothetical protein